jgi:hypothetical protein
MANSCQFASHSLTQLAMEFVLIPHSKFLIPHSKLAQTCEAKARRMLKILAA